MTEMAETILDAAEERIRLAGYNGFSFREIAADVGIKSASVHYHYPTKDKLAAAVARRYTDRFLEGVARRLAAGEAVIAAWRDVFAEAYARDGRMCLCGALGATMPDLAPEVGAEVRRFFERGVDTLVAGGLGRARAIQVLATLEGAMLTANVLQDRQAFDLAAAALTEGGE